MDTDNLNLQLLLSKAIGFAIIGASLILKVPQIVKIFQSKSVEGLSFTMFIMELAGYTINLAYSFNNGYPISTYGENLFIAIQNIIIVYLLFSYTNNDAVFFTGAAGYAVVVYALFGGLVPLDFQSVLQAATIPIFTISKLPQIWMNFSSKSAGQLSLVTVLLNFVGSLARTFTTLTQVKDPLVLAGYLIGATLNGTLLFQILFYGGAESKKKKSA